MGQVFGEDQMATAVIDRVMHHGRLIKFRGKSYRVRHALMQGGCSCSKAVRTQHAHPAQISMIFPLKNC